MVLLKNHPRMIDSTLLFNFDALNGTNGYILQFTGAKTVQSFNIFGTANTWTAAQTTSRPTLGSTAGDEQVFGTYTARDGPSNQSYMIFRSLRMSNGDSHNTSALEIIRKIDTTYHGFIRLHDSYVAVGHENNLFWKYQDDGHQVPAADSALDIGLTGTRVRVVYVDDLSLRPSASRTPAANGDLEIEATNNTTLTFKYKGSDGTVRSGTVTLS